MASPVVRGGSVLIARFSRAHEPERESSRSQPALMVVPQGADLLPRAPAMPAPSTASNLNIRPFSTEPRQSHYVRRGRDTHVEKLPHGKEEVDGSSPSEGFKKSLLDGMV